MEIGVILTASDIPDGSMVQKRTGTQVYRLSKKVKIYGKFNKEMIQEGISFLIKYNDPDNITSAIPNDILLIWITTEEEYYNHLYNKRKSK